MTITGPAITRLILLGLVASILQLTAASQVSVFGVPMDLSPLIVASVGFLAGSVPGMVFGFCFGLFADTALMQTLGVTSLVLTVIGYGAGRVRELRDPAHGLAPVAVGAAATAVAALGVTLLQFLLGVVLLFTSPVAQAAWADLGGAIRVAQLRFFVLEHPVMMTAAIALAEAGLARVTKAPDEKAAARRAAVFVTLSLLLILAAIPWPSRPEVARPLLRGW